MADEIMQLLRATYPAVVGKMEEMVKEISRCVAITPEEHLLPSFLHLDRLCHTYDTCITEQVPAEVQQYLRHMLESEFAFNNPDTAEQNKMTELKNEFQEDFIASTLSSLPKLRDRLAAWIGRLQWRVENLPDYFDLEISSRYLIGFKSNTIEIPGQYFENQEPATDHHVRIDGFQSEVSTRGGIAYRSITMRGSNGRLYPFHLLGRPPKGIRSDERITTLFRLMNEFFDKYKETRRRNVFINNANVVSFSPSLRLLSSNDTYTSLFKIYNEHCLAANLEPHLLSQLLSQQVST